MKLLRRLFAAGESDPQQVLQQKYASFRSLLTTNNEILEQIADLEGALMAGTAMGVAALRTVAQAVQAKATQMVRDLSDIAEGRYTKLYQNIEKIAASVEEALSTVFGAPVTAPCIPLEEITRDLADAVGGKVANLAEVWNLVGLPVPPGFAVTTFAYRAFVEGARLQTRLTEVWDRIPWEDLAGIAAASREMQQIVLGAEIPQSEDRIPPRALPREIKRSFSPWSCEEIQGRNALPRVHNRKRRPDAENRVPTQAAAFIEHHFFTASLAKRGTRAFMHTSYSHVKAKAVSRCACHRSPYPECACLPLVRCYLSLVPRH